MKIFTDTIKTEYLSDTNVVIDIETTGVSRLSNYIQAVGILTNSKVDNFIQLYIDSEEKELELLLKLKELLEEKDLISFNGINFDLPFILSRMDKHLIEHPKINSHEDLYRSIIKNKYFIDLDKYSLQDTEKYFFIDRFENFELEEDFDFYKSQENINIAKLLLHNKYDVINTEKLLLINEVIKNIRTFSLGTNELYLRKIDLSKDNIYMYFNSNELKHLKYEDSFSELAWNDNEVIIRLALIEGFISEGILGYVYRQRINQLKDLSSFNLPNNILLIYSYNRIHIENLKSLCDFLYKK